MDDAVRQRGLAVVDMGDDGKVADVLHQGSGWPRKKVITGRRQNSPAIKKGHTVCPLMAWPLVARISGPCKFLFKTDILANFDEISTCPIDSFARTIRG